MVCSSPVLGKHLFPCPHGAPSRFFEILCGFQVSINALSCCIAAKIWQIYVNLGSGSKEPTHLNDIYTVYVYKYIYIYVYIYINVYIYVDIYMYICVHVHVHMYVHTHIIHIHMYICKNMYIYI